MKKIVVGVVLLVLGVGTAGAVDVTVTNWFGGYVMKSAATFDAGDTGLATNVAYACFPLSVLTGTTEATGTNDVRAVVWGMLDHLYDAFQAVDATNRPANLTVDEDVVISVSGTNVDNVVVHQVKTRRRITGATIPNE